MKYTVKAQIKNETIESFVFDCIEDAKQRYKELLKTGNSFRLWDSANDYKTKDKILILHLIDGNNTILESQRFNNLITITTKEIIKELAKEIERLQEKRRLNTTINNQLSLWGFQ